MKQLTISDRLDYAAQCGAYEIYLFVWKNTAKRLIKDGLVLTETNIRSERKGEHYYGISWKNAQVEIPEGAFEIDKMLLDLRSKDVPLNQANILWLIAEEKNRRTNK